MIDRRGPDAGPAEERRDLFRVIRHDLRTPINHIVGYSDLLLDVAADDALVQPHTADLVRIRSAGHDLLAMVNELFAPSRGEVDDAALRAMCHGLRTPLDAVIGYSDLVLEEIDDTATEAADDVRRIRAAGEQMVRLVDAVIGLAAGAAPIAASRGLAASAARPPEAERETGTVLVVDDNELNRDVLARRLERQGYQVAAAADGAAALARLAEGGVDLVLLDVVMPGMSGYEVCQAIRADPATAMLPVVVVTASDAEEKIQAIESGADDLIPKPFDPAELLARVRSLLRIKRYHDTIAAQRAQLADWNRTLEERVQAQVEQIDRLGRLRRFLSPQLADLVVSSGDESFLRSHRREIAVVFCDLRGFSAFAETAEPEEVTEVIGAYHAALGEVVRGYDATVDHFAGDGLLVFFNDPLPCAEPALRAVAAAVAMRARMDELKARWRRRGQTLGFGVGVTFGYATLGQIGFEGRHDYTANGAVVNLAARLCAEAHDGQILVSQRVVNAVEDAVEVEPIGELVLKGFHRPVAVHDVRALLREPPR